MGTLVERLRESPKPVGLMHGRPWMSVRNFITIHPIDVQIFHPKVVDRQTAQQTNNVIPGATPLAGLKISSEKKSFSGLHLWFLIQQEQKALVEILRSPEELPDCQVHLRCGSADIKVKNVWPNGKAVFPEKVASLPQILSSSICRRRTEQSFQLTLQAWLRKYSAPLIKLAKFECQDLCSRAEAQKRQQYITTYHATVAIYEGHMSPFISLYIATFILQGHLLTRSTARASSIAVAWNWISSHHHALLNKSSLSNLAGSPGKLSDLSNM